MEGDFIKKSCCGATFGHAHHCSHYEAAKHSDTVISGRNRENEELRTLTEQLRLAEVIVDALAIHENATNAIVQARLYRDKYPKENQ